MALKIEKIEEVCGSISRAINDRHKNLTLSFIVYRPGPSGRANAIKSPGAEVVEHPAAHIAKRLLTNPRSEEDMDLCGVALAREQLFFGLAVRDSLLAVALLNAGRYKTLKDIRAHSWHLAWHALDTLAYHNDPSSFTGVLSDVIVRQRTPIERAAANLKADVFAAVMSALQGSGEPVQTLAVERARAAMEARPGHDPDHFPFLLAEEATLIALQHVKEKPVPKKKYIDEALKAARYVGAAFDEEWIQGWINFCEPSQDMAWRGYNGEQILSAAINTSEDTYVRTLAHMIADITKIKPVSVWELPGDYSPFCNEGFNERMHERMVDRIFDETFREVRRMGSAQPYVDIANSQNLKLISGHIMGWCAGALQASAATYTQAVANGGDADAASRKTFETERSRTAWSALRALNRKIVSSYRSRIPVTLPALLEMCGDERSAEVLAASIAETMRNHEDGHLPEPVAHIGVAQMKSAIPSGPAEPPPPPELSFEDTPKSK